MSMENGVARAGWNRFPAAKRGRMRKKKDKGGLAARRGEPGSELGQGQDAAGQRGEPAGHPSRRTPCWDWLLRHYNCGCRGTGGLLGGFWIVGDAAFAGVAAAGFCASAAAKSDLLNFGALT